MSERVSNNSYGIAGCQKVRGEGPSGDVEPSEVTRSLFSAEYGFRRRIAAGRSQSRVRVPRRYENERLVALGTSFQNISGQEVPNFCRKRKRQGDPGFLLNDGYGPRLPRDVEQSKVTDIDRSQTHAKREHGHGSASQFRR